MTQKEIKAKISAIQKVMEVLKPRYPKKMVTRESKHMAHWMIPSISG